LKNYQERREHFICYLFNSVFNNVVTKAI